MINQAIEQKAERLAQLVGKDSGELLVDELLDKERERIALQITVERAKGSGLSAFTTEGDFVREIKDRVEKRRVKNAL